MILRIELQRVRDQVNRTRRRPCASQADRHSPEDHPTVVEIRTRGPYLRRVGEHLIGSSLRAHQTRYRCLPANVRSEVGLGCAKHAPQLLQTLSD